MKRLAHKWFSHPAGKLVSAVSASSAALMASAPARADTQFAEFGGVPEGLALRAMALDMDWSWSLLGMIVVVALVAADYVKGGKCKD